MPSLGLSTWRDLLVPVVDVVDRDLIDRRGAERRIQRPARGCTGSDPASSDATIVPSSYGFLASAARTPRRSVLPSWPRCGRPGRAPRRSAGSRHVALPATRWRRPSNRRSTAVGEACRRVRCTQRGSVPTVAARPCRSCVGSSCSPSSKAPLEVILSRLPPLFPLFPRRYWKWTGREQKRNNGDQSCPRMSTAVSTTAMLRSLILRAIRAHGQVRSGQIDRTLRWGSNPVSPTERDPRSDSPRGGGHRPAASLCQIGWLCLRQR